MVTPPPTLALGGPAQGPQWASPAGQAPASWGQYQVAEHPPVYLTNQNRTAIAVAGPLRASNGQSMVFNSTGLNGQGY